MMTVNQGAQCRRSDRGFTLVELLVVIAIIGILVALISPAIFGAVSRAKIARIRIEITAMSQALEDYKTRYGQYPPDLSGVNPSNLTLASVNAAGYNDYKAIQLHLQRSFRDRTTTGADNNNQLGADVLPIRPAGSAWYPEPVAMTLQDSSDLAEIDPSEALVLWLSGFSPDPRNPLRGVNHAPLFEFDKARLIDPDGDGYPSYYPKGDKTGSPYLYYASSNGGYQATALGVQAINNNGGVKTSSSQKLIPVPYANAPSNYAEANRYQIVSAGQDGDYVETSLASAYGWSTFTFNNYKSYYDAVVNTPTKTRPYALNPLPKAERDNLSNFCEKGTFKDAVND